MSELWEVSGCHGVPKKTSFLTLQSNLVSSGRSANSLSEFVSSGSRFVVNEFLLIALSGWCPCGNILGTFPKCLGSP
jgi:hypothetical protein